MFFWPPWPHEQDAAAFDPLHRVPLALGGVPNYRIKAAAEVEAIVLMARCDASTYIFRSCELQPPLDELASEAFALMVWVHTAETEVPIYRALSIPVMRKVRERVFQDGAFARIQSTIVRRGEGWESIGA